MAEDNFYEEEKSSSGLVILIAGIAFLLALGALAWIYSLQNRLGTVETRLDQFQEQTAQEAARQAEIRRQLQATTEAFGAKVGITQQQIESRAQEILRKQQTLAAHMSQQEAATRKQVNSVSNAVSSVQTDVGGVKQDVANTRRELTSTEQQLHAAIGDLGVQSGLIAKNSGQLDYLRQLGDRNYFAFTLHKGKQPVAVSTIKLRLRKADTKHSRYTLEVFSDDKKIQKKNRDLDEPLQFYSGNPPMLFEIVVNQVNRDEVSGYLSTPKTAPQPAVVP